MSDKPRVYQGVRVKTTVKELLQRHRAREASRKKLKTISQACLELQELQDLCASTLPNFIPSARYVDPAPPPPPPPPPPATTTTTATINTPAELSSCGARALQLRSAPYPVPLPLPDSSCHSSGGSSIPVQGDAFTDIQQQFGDLMLPSNCYNSNNNNNNIIVGGGGGGGYSASLPPPPALPLPWCHGLSSDTDFYGTGMAPCSSPESLKLCSPVDQNSYSPQDSFSSSSSSSSCYDSPTRMESGFSGFSSDHYHHPHHHHHHHHYPQCSLQDCYCLPHCWPGQQETYPAPEYSGYYGPSDFGYGCTAAEENILRRELQMSSEMCYNAL